MRIGRFARADVFRQIIADDLEMVEGRLDGSAAAVSAESTDPRRS